MYGRPLAYWCTDSCQRAYWPVVAKQQTEKDQMESRKLGVGYELNHNDVKAADRWCERVVDAK